MSVTARVIVTQNLQIGSEGNSAIIFAPDYADDRNAEWAVATPTLRFEMTVKPEVAALFEIGDRLEVTFTKQEEEPAAPTAPPSLY